MNKAAANRHDPAQMPLLGFVEYVPTGEDNTFRAVQRPPVQLTPIAKAAKASGYSHATIYRLFKEGTIAGVHLSPRKILIDMQSLQALREASTQESFWPEERKRREDRKKMRQVRQVDQAR